MPAATSRRRCATRCWTATSRPLAGARPDWRSSALRGPGGAAPRQGDRHLHPPLPARRQARLSRAHPARLAAAERALRTIRRWLPVRRWFDRHLPQPRRRAAPPRIRHAYDGAPASAGAWSAAPGDGAGRRASARGCGRSPIAFPKPLIEIGGRTDARPRDRSRWRRTESSRSWSTPTIWRRCARTAISPAATRRRSRLCIEAERLETGGGVATRCRCSATSRSSSSTATSSGATATADAWRDLAAAWDDRRMDALLLLHPVATALGYDGQRRLLPATGDRTPGSPPRTASARRSCSPASRSCIRGLLGGRRTARSRSTSSMTGRSTPGGCTASCMTASGATSARPPTSRRPRRSCRSL